ncbi:atypical abc1 abc1-c protein kinase [Nannochloropsis oceanica]
MAMRRALTAAGPRIIYATTARTSTNSSTRVLLERLQCAVVRLHQQFNALVVVRLFASDVNCLFNRTYKCYEEDWCVPTLSAAAILSVSPATTITTTEASTALQTRRQRWARLWRAFIRGCQVSLVLSPLLATFPFMYVTRSVFPWFRRKWWTCALWSIEALGPCMVKFMQWASTRRDILATEVCDLLEPIQWQTRPHTWAKTLQALATLRCDWEKVLTIDQGNGAMLGSGSVAQVYRATTTVQPGREEGDPTAPPPAPRVVAVKVIHPGVKRQIEADLELFRLGAWLVEMTGHLQWWSVRDFVEEFAEIMHMQLDLRSEAKALDRFRENFKARTDIVFPEPLWPLVNEFVLVEDYVGGVPISQILKDPAWPVAEKKAIARSGLDAFLKMVFLDNFVHGDLHPGNIFVHPATSAHKGKPYLTFIDAGIVTELSSQDRRNFVDLFYAIATGKGEAAGRLMIDRARDHACVDPEGFSKGIARIVEEATAGHNLQLGKIRVGFLIQKVLALCIQYKVKLESNFASTLLAIGVLEGVGRSLDPNLDILTAATPIIVKSQYFQSKKA